MSDEKGLVMKWFGKYYQECPPPAPDRFGRREFGFMFFDRNYVQRHLSFSKVADIQSFLRNQIPAHVYHSSAYYLNPGAPTMGEKTWLGADLVFDLDADHLKGAEGLTYQQMLAQVKVQFIKLLDEFLMGDLGFDESDIRIVFSGGRGYHAHVSAEGVLGLKSHERREIVDYITGTDLSMEWAFPEKASFEKRFGERQMVQKSRLLPSPGSGGWRGRMRMGLEALLSELSSEDPDLMRERYPSTEEASNRLLKGLMEEVAATKGGRRVADLIMERGNLEDLGGKRRALLLSILEKDVVNELGGQVDEPVTSDIKRLIRMPGSLHGKSSLMVTEMDRDSLSDFDPLRDAIPTVFGEEPVTIMTEEAIDVELGGDGFSLDGEEEVPMFLAMFLLCRRQAHLPPSSA
jgi:DNA primase small subunit